MDSNLNSKNFLESFACAHISDGFLEDDGWDMMNSFIQSEGSPILKIKDLKDRGNNLFKEKCFGAAAACYDEACKLLGFVVGMEGSYDTKSMSDLAVSLNLNLAACALKLFEHEATKDLCSMVLSFYPHNVKALFRRGLAFMKLNKFLDAQSDFEEALLVEPRNKDIHRELSVVRNCLTINSNGKRRMDDHSIQVETGKGKIHVQEDGPIWNSSIDSGACSESVSGLGSTSVHDNTISYSGGSITQSSVIEKCDMELDTNNLVLDQQSGMDSVSTSSSVVSCNFDGCANIGSRDSIDSNMNLNLKPEETNGMEKPLLQFSKKGGGHSVLRIDTRTYKKLLEGREVSFFQKSQVSTMKLRILQPTIIEPERGFGPYKQKKKRSRRKKCSQDTLSEGAKIDVRDISCLDVIKASDCEMTVEKATPSVSGESVNKHVVCDSMDSTYHHPTPFVFTSIKRKIPKVFSGKRQASRIQSRREESPRRNVCFYPGKFPRLRDVSVSCCRYSPKAHLPKKRKGMTYSMCCSKWCSRKKARFISTPTPSLSFCNNNVALAPDLGSRCSM